MKPGTALLLMCLCAADANARVRGPAAAGTTASLQRSSATVTLGSARSPEGRRVLQVDAFGQRHTLRLRPAAEPFADTFRLQTTARDEEGRLIFKDVPHDEERDAGELYQDPESGGVVRVRGARVEGVISPTLTLAAGADGRHEAVRQEILPDHDDEDYLEVPLEERPHPGSSDRTRAVSSATVEMYVIVDSMLAESLGTDQRVKDYLGVFWNAVNLRFATISDPKIQLVLAGALIVRDAADEPYITENIIREKSVVGLQSCIALAKWLKKQETKLPSYDMAYLMTGRDMGKYYGSSYSTGLLGLSYIKSACRSNDKKVFKLAIGEDNRYFQGIFVAAHEVGHNLGAEHDPGNRPDHECYSGLGYIMTPSPMATKRLFFSPCSVKAMKEYISKPEAACLQETSIGSKIPLSTTLPGQLLSLDQQCMAAMKSKNTRASTTVPESSHCSSLECEVTEADGSSVTWNTFLPAAEGTPCRSGGACKDGSCQ